VLPSVDDKNAFAGISTLSEYFPSNSVIFLVKIVMNRSLCNSFSSLTHASMQQQNSTSKVHVCLVGIYVITDQQIDWSFIQVINHYILSGQTPQDAVGGQFDMVYKEMVYIVCSLKVWSSVLSQEIGREERLRND